jgi:integrase
VLTGQRPGEIMRITTNALFEPELDREGVSRGVYYPDEKTIFWDKTKNGRSHLLPLPAQALSILDSLPAVEPCGWFFPRRDDYLRSAKPNGVLQLVRRYIKDTGAAPFTPRDLRRTWKTLAGKAGVSKEDRDLIQNHAKGDVSSKHYDHYDYYAEKRAAMDAWGVYFDRIIAGELDTEVVSLGRRWAVRGPAAVRA